MGYIRHGLRLAGEFVSFLNWHDYWIDKGLILALLARFSIPRIVLVSILAAIISAASVRQVSLSLLYFLNACKGKARLDLCN